MARGTIVQVSATPTVSASSAYSSGDAVGALLTFSHSLIKFSKSGKLESLVVTDLASQAAALQFVIFATNPSATTFTDNAALDIADADIGKIIGWVPIASSDYTAFNDNSVACVRNIGLGLFNDADSYDLYGCLKTTGTPTYASTADLVVSMFIRQD